MKLQHTFPTKGHNPLELFQGTKTLQEFCKKLEQQANKDPDRYPTQKYLGDGFECFVEMLLALHPCDGRLGVHNYTPNLTDDNGVDGTGINTRLEKCVVQIKYRKNRQHMLTATEDKLSNLFSSGDAAFRVTVDHDNPKNFRHFVFTTAAGLHFYTDREMFQGRVKCFGQKELRAIVDNNPIFWQKAAELIAANKNHCLTPTHP